jgi:hypothetical protein
VNAREDARRNLIATSRAFVPPWSLIFDETGPLSDQSLNQISRNPSCPKDSVFHRASREFNKAVSIPNRKTAVFSAFISPFRKKSKNSFTKPKHYFQVSPINGAALYLVELNRR